jgi:hypothetical protein
VLTIVTTGELMHYHGIDPFRHFDISNRSLFSQSNSPKALCSRLSCVHVHNSGPSSQAQLLLRLCLLAMYGKFCLPYGLIIAKALDPLAINITRTDPKGQAVWSAAFN